MAMFVNSEEDVVVSGGTVCPLVCHLPPQTRKFGWNVNGKIKFVSSNGETGFLERWTKFANGKCAFASLH